MVVVSDKGFACSVQLLRGIDKETDADALAAVKNWTLKPATKDGRPVPVVVTVEVNYMMKDGKLVRAPYPARNNDTFTLRRFRKLGSARYSLSPAGRHLA